jgi:HK97 family phage major capsid protein
MMNLDVMNEIRTFSSSSNGTYYTVDLTEGYGFRVLGRPAYENSNFAEFTGTTGASNILVVGDFSNYVVYDRVGSTLEYIPHLFSTGNGRPTGQRGWIMWFRTGADMVTSATNPGFRLLQNQ